MRHLLLLAACDDKAQDTGETVDCDIAMDAEGFAADERIVTVSADA